jgi:hypothetical protein
MSVRFASAISKKLVEYETRPLNGENITDKTDVRALSNTEFSSELNTMFLCYEFLCVCVAYRHISLRDDAFDLSRD